MRLGASTRGALAMYRTSQALAHARGRDYVLPDDVKELAPHVLAHRLVRDTKARYSGVSKESVVEEILQRVQGPHLMTLARDPRVLLGRRDVAAQASLPPGTGFALPPPRLRGAPDLHGHHGDVVRHPVHGRGRHHPGHADLRGVLPDCEHGSPSPSRWRDWLVHPSPSAAIFPLTPPAVPASLFPSHVTNQGRQPAMDVIVRDWQVPSGVRVHPRDGTYIRSLAPGETCVIQRDLEFTKRGHYEMLGMRQETVFPWGLWKDLRDHPHSRSLLVYPSFHPLVHLDLPVGKRYQPGGIALSSNVGDSIEFIGTREYRDGDNVKAIHWRTWARLGKPAVKEFQEEYFCRIALLMDTFIPLEGGPSPPRGFRGRHLPGRGPWPTACRAKSTSSTSLPPAPRSTTCSRAAAWPTWRTFSTSLPAWSLARRSRSRRSPPILVENLESITTVVVVLLDLGRAAGADGPHHPRPRLGGQGDGGERWRHHGRCGAPRGISRTS